MTYKNFQASIFLIIITTFTVNCVINTQVLMQENEICKCLNGGTCSTTDKYMACNCPPGFIGTRCETPATLISKTDQQITINQNYSYFYFQPTEINYYQIALKICLPEQDLNKLTNLVFLQVERSSGKLKLEPSIYQTSPMTLQGGQDRCQTFYTHFIPIRKKLNNQFQKIIFGVAIKNNSDNAANRWVNFLQRTAADPQQSLKSKQILNDQVNEESLSNSIQIQHQKVIISCTYELYLVENYWGTFIIIMSAITLFVSTAAFLYTIRNKYSYTLSNQDILRMYAFNPEQFISQENIKNDLSHFRFTMPIMSYELLIEKIKRNANKKNEKRKKANKKLSYQQKNKQKQQQDTQHYSPDQLVHEKEIEENKNQVELQIESTCTICLLNFENDQKVRQTPCHHIFHSDCIDCWCENTLNCPVCRQKLEHPRMKKKRQAALEL